MDYSKTTYKCDITKIPVKNKRFDIIILTEVLEHLPEPYKALKELNRILKGGGKIYLTTPQRWAEHEAPYDYYRYTQYGLKYLLEKSGFKVLYIGKRGGYFKYLSFRMWRFIFLPSMNRKNIIKKGLGFIIKLMVIPFLIFFSLFAYLFDNILDREKELTRGYQVIAIKN